jgi:4-hydroxy-tetrahydrodipicolinate reductase
MAVIRVGIVGLSGRMGTAISDELIKNDLFVLKKALTRTRIKETLFKKLKQTDNYEVFLTDIDLIIDFSAADVTNFILETMLMRGQFVPFVIGTPGLSSIEGIDLKIKTLSQNIPIFISSNMSIAIGLLMTLAKTVSSFYAKLNELYIKHDIDVEIVEAHHRFKKDAPSGTAILLGESVAKGRNQSFADVACFNRLGTRQNHEIGFHSLRGGHIFGEHSVHFIGDDEEIVLNHKAFNRHVFAKGALNIGKWLVSQKNGLYTMDDFSRQFF